MKTNGTIAIIMATRIEALPFIRGLHLAPLEKKPVKIFGNNGIVIAISGIGKSNAAIATTHLADAYRPSLVFNLGAAGSAGDRLNIGDIVHINEIIELDRPGLLRGRPVLHKPNVLKGFRTVALATRDRPVIAPEDRAAAGTYADCVDMEGAAVAQACRAFGIRAYLFKIITDNAETGKFEIIKNIQASRNALYGFFVEKIMPAARAQA